MFQNRYLFDVNPSIRFRKRQRDNVIDARFIDTTTGGMIDFTVVGFRHPTLSPELLSCKSPHYYTYDELFPLVETIFEGEKIFRPHSPAVVLAREYGAESLIEDTFFNYRFDQGKWSPVEK